MAFRHGNGAAGIQQVKGVRSFEHLFVSRQGQSSFDHALAFAFAHVELVEQGFDIGVFKVIGGLLDFVLVVNVTVSHHALRAFCPHQIVDALHVLHVHGEAFQTVGDFTADRAAIQPADLLEISELGHFHAVEPYFPTQTPRAQRWRFPVVFDETDVMHQRVKAQQLERAEVEFLNIVRGGL